MTLYFLGHAVLRILCLAFLVALAVFTARKLSRREDAALETLERRFAAGELSEEDFRRMRDVLRE